MALFEEPTPLDLYQHILVLAEAADAQLPVLALTYAKGVGTNRTAVRIAFDGGPAYEVPSAPAIGSRSGAKSFEVTSYLGLSLTVSERCVKNAIFHEVTHESFDVPVIEKVILRSNEANDGRAILGAQGAGSSHARCLLVWWVPPTHPSWQGQVIIAALEQSRRTRLAVLTTRRTAPRPPGRDHVHLQILATSREPLGIDGEAAWPVRSLAVPTDEHLVAAELREFTAAEALVARVQSTLPRAARSIRTFRANLRRIVGRHENRKATSRASATP
jgi:hypothetical protein